LPDVPAERAALLAFLDAQRRSVVAIVEGLAPDAVQQSVVPSRWTPLSLVEHLARAEYFWFEAVVAGQVGPAPWSVSNHDAPQGGRATDPLTWDDVLAIYLEQCGRSDRVVAARALDAEPTVPVPPDMPDEIHDVRTIILHMIEETARHAGHLDIARELIDGVTGLGPR